MELYYTDDVTWYTETVMKSEPVSAFSGESHAGLRRQCGDGVVGDAFSERGSQVRQVLVANERCVRACWQHPRQLRQGRHCVAVQRTGSPVRAAFFGMRVVREVLLLRMSRVHGRPPPEEKGGGKEGQQQ